MTYRLVDGKGGPMARIRGFLFLFFFTFASMEYWVAFGLMYVNWNRNKNSS